MTIKVAVTLNLFQGLILQRRSTKTLKQVQGDENGVQTRLNLILQRQQRRISAGACRVRTGRAFGAETVEIVRTARLGSGAR